MFDIDGQDKLKVAIEHDLNENNEEYVLSAELQEVLQDLKKQEQLPLLPSHLKPLPLTIPKENLLPSVLQAPKASDQVGFGRVSFGSVYFGSVIFRMRITMSHTRVRSVSHGSVEDQLFELSS